MLILNEDTGQTELYGLLPTLSWDTLEDPSQLAAVIEGLTVTCKGISSEVKKAAFHPNRPEVLLQLHPSAPGYQVHIESDVTGLNIAGVWKADEVSDGDLFVGERHRGERIQQDASVSEGDFVFLVLKTLPDLRSVPRHLYELHMHGLGALHLVAFELTELTRFILSRYGDENVVDENAFQVDTLIPAYANPGTEAPIGAPPLTQSIVAIVPPKNLDPKFEVIPIPLSEEELEPIPRLGPGVPRFISLPFPEVGSKRINIHWGGRHRVVHLHADAGEDDVDTFWETAHPRIGVRVVEDDEVLIPWLESSSHTLEVSRESSLSNLLEVVGPPGMRVNLYGRFQEEGEVRGTVRAVDLSFTEVMTRLEDWIYEGCEEFSIEFDSLGAVRFTLRTTSRLWRKYQYAELLERVGKNDSLPSKASWSFVRKVLGVPLETPRRSIPGGTKKKIRRALREVKTRERRD